MDSELIKVNAASARLHRMKRGVVTASRLHSEVVPKSYKPAMVTLTYRPGREWRGSDVRDYLRRVRQFCKEKGFVFRYVWVAELQKRGAVHYHVLVWLPGGVKLPKADLSGWWAWGLSRMEWAKAPIRYLIKYSSKLAGKGAALPRGLRLHGAGGLDGPGRGVRRWWCAPAFVRKVWTEETAVRRASGEGVSFSGWVSERTGELIRSPWVFAGVSGGMVYLIRRNYA